MYLGLLRFDDLAILVLLGLDQRVKLRIIHEHFLLDLRISNQHLLLKVLSLCKRIIDQLLHSVDLYKKIGIFDLLMSQIQKPLFQRFGDSIQR